MPDASSNLTPAEGAEGNTPAQYALTRERTECLAETLVRPTRYLQRFVEQVSFLPDGGQQWTRTLQVRIPETGPPGRSWYVVSLGQYARRRFPDLLPTDAAGERLTLLTRRQHGIVLTKVAVLSHIYTLPEEQYGKLEDELVQPVYKRFRDALYQVFVTAGDLTPTDDYLLDLDGLRADPKSLFDARQRKAFEHNYPLALIFHELLELLGASPELILESLDRFARDFEEITKTTRYLCWVQAKADDVMTIQVLYTVSDAEQALERTALRDSLTQIKQGLSFRKSKRREETWANWYRQFGLAPINYAFRSPSRRTSSYYFSIRPPSASSVTYLDWEIGNSLEDKEIDSALLSAHIHNGDRLPNVPVETGGGRIRAFIRCTPHQHKQVLGVALINCALVYLFAKGLLADRLGTSVQGIVLAAPPVLIAYLVQQQRHYYAHAVRRQRAILWIYLAISVLFPFSVAFSPTGLSQAKPEFFVVFVAFLLAASSTGVFCWYLPLGYSYQSHVARRAQQERERFADERPESQMPPLWHFYSNAVHRYCTAILRFAILMMALVTVMLALFWNSLEGHAKAQANADGTGARDEQTSKGASTARPTPTATCQGCNVNLWLAPPRQEGDRR